MAVKAANDANAAALGEMWAGGGKGSKNLVMVTLGTGVGGGIIVDGKIVAGAHGAGGEVGHACVEPGRRSGLQLRKPRMPRADDICNRYRSSGKENIWHPMILRLL